MKKDFVVIFVTEALVLVSGLMVYKFAASFLGQNGFSEYAISRRTVSLIQPALIMGLGVGIPRYVAYAEGDSVKSDSYFLGGMSVLILMALASTAFLNLFKKDFAFLMFGDSAYTYLIHPVSLMLLGLLLHFACYGYFMGRLQMVRANFLQVINIGLAPLLAFGIGSSTTQVLTAIGVFWILVSSFSICLIARNLKIDVKAIMPCTKELLFYGVQRVPGDFGMAALLTLPATITAHAAGIKEAGYVAFGISLLNMGASGFAPIGLILLPKGSQMIAKKDFIMLRHYVGRILKITFLLSSAGIIVFEIFARKIIDVYLGEGFSETVLIARIIVVSGIAYSIYVAMRSIIDAYYIRAVNTLNIIGCLFLFCCLSSIVAMLSKGYICIIICFDGAIALLGCLTLYEVRRIFVRTIK